MTKTSARPPSAIDISGQKYGRLTVLKRQGVDSGRRATWECICECGTIATIVGNKLRSGYTQSCGCLQRERTSQSNMDDLTGKVFGRLTVVSLRGRANTRALKWFCRCVCGGSTVAFGSNLRQGKTSSCGCRKLEVISIRGETVGYVGAHQRVRKDRGKASLYACVDCGDPAEQWSYNHQDPLEMSVTQEDARTGVIRPMPYSGNPSYYEPRCIGCHNVFDINNANGGMRRK